MSGSVLGGLTAGGDIADADLFYATQSGADRKVTGAQVRAYISPGASILIASAIGVDLNTAGDTAMTVSAFATGKFFVVDYCLWTNPDATLTTVEGRISSGAGGTGQSYANFAGDSSGLANPRDWQTVFSNNVAFNGGPGTMQNTAPIVNVATPEGSAATADFYVYGRVFP